MAELGIRLTLLRNIARFNPMSFWQTIGILIELGAMVCLGFGLILGLSVFVLIFVLTIAIT